MADLITANEMFFTAFEPKTSNRFIMHVDGIPIIGKGYVPTIINN